MNKLYSYFAFFLAILFQSFTLYAQQQQPIVTGKVLNEDHKAQTNVSIYLMSAKANAVIKTTVTDEDGKYTFTLVPAGEFVVQASAVGFETARSNALQVKTTAVQVEAITLKVMTNTISPLSVEARIPSLQQKDGKLILNVENSTLAVGNNALDIVQRAPGVSVDKDNNLQLMGQQGVKVTIDGRQTYMSGEQLASFLKSMDGSQIKSVEVGTSRNARDDAEGAVGSINIVLKKNKLEGFNGAFLASAGHGKDVRGNSSINLNYKRNNTTLFGNYAYTQDKRVTELSVLRNVYSPKGDRIFDQTGELFDNTKSQNYKVGIEQRTSPRNVMLLQFSGGNSRERESNASTTNIGSQAVATDSILNTKSNTYSPFNRYSLNFNNEFKIDTVGTKLVLDLDWSAIRNDSKIDYNYRTMFPDSSLIYPDEIERTQMPVKIDIYVAKLDYERMLGKAKLELGAKYSQVRSDNNLQFDHWINEQWQEYEGRPNHFMYKEQISAAYADYSRAFGKLSMKLGARGEYTVSDGNSLTLNNRVKRDYFNLFPSASFGYTFNENNILSLSYARKVSRPNYKHLNPFEYFIDKFTSQRGNAYLNPQYTDGITLNYTLHKMFNISLGTDITNDAMVESLGQDEETGKAWVTRENLGKTLTSYVNLNAPFRIGKVWTMNNNFTGIYMHFKGPIAGSVLDVGSFFLQARSNHNFRLSKTFSTELSVNYNSPFLYNVYKIHTRWGADIGASYNFKDQRSSLKLAATDIFKTQKNNLTTDYAEFNSTIKQYNDNRVIRLSYTYKFGNLKQQIRRKSTDSDEKSRAQ